MYRMAIAALVFLCCTPAFAAPFIARVDPAASACFALSATGPEGQFLSETKCDLSVYVLPSGLGGEEDVNATQLACVNQACSPADDDWCREFAPLFYGAIMGVSTQTCQAVIDDAANNYYEFDLTAREGYILVDDAQVAGSISSTSGEQNNGRD